MRTVDFNKQQTRDTKLREIFTKMNYTIVHPHDTIHAGSLVTVKCDVCGGIQVDKKVTAFTSVFSHHKTRSCPQCKQNTLLSTRDNQIKKFIGDLETNTPIRLVDTIIPCSYTIRYLFSSTHCGHEFLSTLNNIKTNNPTVCSACSRLQAKETLRSTSKVKSAANKKLTPTLIGYMREVRAVTESTYREYKSLINPSNHLRSHAKHKTGYQLDHIIPVRLGYELRLSPDIVGGVDNLQMLDWETNIKVQEFLDRKIHLVPNTKQQIHQLCVQYPHVVFDGVDISLTREYMESDYYLNFPFLEFVPSNKNKRLTQQQFIDRIATISPNLNVVGQYVNSYTKIEMGCKCGHTWLSKPNDLQKGHSCPKCARIKKSILNV